MIKIVGDTHGKITKYVNIVKDCDHSIQIGDLGFDYSGLSVLDPVKHRVIGGNHDNYTNHGPGEPFHMQTKHFLGDYGVYEVDGRSIFFVRGGHSIDKKYRTEGVDWWPEEQITYKLGVDAILSYTKADCPIMLAHECPVSAIDYISGLKTYDGELIRPSFTAHLLQAMFDIRQPDIFIHGHHHVDKTYHIGKTKFICLNELSHIDI